MPTHEYINDKYDDMIQATREYHDRAKEQIEAEYEITGDEDLRNKELKELKAQVDEKINTYESDRLAALKNRGNNGYETDKDRDAFRYRGEDGPNPEKSHFDPSKDRSGPEHEMER